MYPAGAMFFDDTWMLWALGPAYAIWVVLWLLRTRGAPGASVRFSALRRLSGLRRSWRLRLRPLVLALRLLTVGLLVLAMARPQTGRELSKEHTEGIDIMLVVDTSGSMRALDLDADRPIARRRDRLAVVTDVMAEFVSKRDSDQIGLVVFGSEAYTQCPLTLDHGIVATFLDRLEIGMAGDATAVGSALGAAIKRLRQSEAESKVVVLLTDGRSNAGSITPTQAAEIARTFGVKVYAIGAGTRGKVPILEDTLFGPQVRYIEADLDEDSLRAIASATGGGYWRAEDADALEAIYDQIDRLEKSEVETERILEVDERYPRLVWPALVLLLLELVLLSTRFRRIP